MDGTTEVDYVQIPLETVITELGDDFHELIHAPKSSQVFIHDAEFYDTAQEMLPGQNTLLHLVSFESLSFSELERIFYAAKENEYVAIAAKIRDENLDIVTELAKKYDLALLRVSTYVPWQRYDSAFTNLLGIYGVPSSKRAIASSHDIYTIANSIAERFGGSVVIEDLARDILGYSTIDKQTIDNARVTEILTRSGHSDEDKLPLYQQVFTASGPVFFSAEDNRLPRIGIALRGGTLPLGSIWIITTQYLTRDSISPDTWDLLEEASNLASQYILREHNNDVRGNLSRNMTLAHALSGNAISAGQRFNLLVNNANQGILLGFTYNHRFGRTSQATLQQLHWQASRFFHGSVPGASFTLIDRTCYVYLPTDNVTRAEELADRFLKVPRANASYRGAISSCAPPERICDIQKSEVDDLLRLNPHHVTAQTNEVPVSTRALSARKDLSLLLLSKVTNQLKHMPSFSQSTTLKLKDHDETHSTEYFPTLLKFLDNACNYGLTAQDMKIHVNTVRYRIRKIQEDFPINIEDPHLRLMVWLELRAVSGEFQL